MFTNQSLLELDLSDNGLDSATLSVAAQMMTQNKYLQILNLSDNPICGPNMDGLNDLKAAFYVNTSLMTLHLNNTGLDSEGAIILAEALPEMRCLRRLDLADNSRVELAGIMALAVSARMNKSLICLDLDIIVRAFFTVHS